MARINKLVGGIEKVVGSAKGIALAAVIALTSQYYGCAHKGIVINPKNEQIDVTVNIKDLSYKYGVPLPSKCYFETGPFGEDVKFIGCDYPQRPTEQGKQVQEKESKEQKQIEKKGDIEDTKKNDDI